MPIQKDAIEFNESYSHVNVNSIEAVEIARIIDSHDCFESINLVL